MIFVTETWLKPATPDSFLNVHKHFSLVRCDRKISDGGGVCVVIRKDLHYCLVVVPDKFSSLELVAVDLILSRGKVRYVLCYRPPYYDNTAKVYALNMIECLKCLINCSWPCVILGDFNLPLINWNENRAPNSHIYVNFMDFVITNGFVQAVDQPTREDNILDLILCNTPLLINDCAVIAPLGNSDHNTVMFNISDSSSTSSVTGPTLTVKDFKSADFDAINNYLAAVNWQEILANIHDVQVMWDVFSSILEFAINKYVPVRIIKLDRHTDLRSYPKYIKRLFSQKLSAWRLYRKFRTEALKQKYKASSQKCDDAVNEYIKKKENSLIDGGSLGDFYRYVNNKISNRTGVAALKDSNGEFITDDCGKAEKLNAFFSSVFTEDNHILPDGNSGTAQHVIDDVNFSNVEVFRILSRLKPKFSAGPDGYSAFFLKHVAGSVAFPLTLLFNQSFCSGEIPAVWRQAVVTPAFKKGNASEPNNYRPISLTCVCCRVMETVIKKQVIDFLLMNGKINKQQHGFLARHSTCSQIIECVNDWSIALNARRQVDVIYIDFCKAFDSVVHNKLLFKLEQIGIRGKLLFWIAAFLRERSQIVRVGRATSDSIDVISGVPQGSVLGPLLFLVYINDIVNIFDDKVDIKLFADDVKIYVVIDNICDCLLLQRSLSNLLEWANIWQLKISIPKCSVLHLGIPHVDFKYNVGGIDLPDVKAVVDLGVCVCSKLKFSQHIHNIVTRANQRSSLILRCFKCRDPVILCRAFVVYVRPILEYCSQVWSPCYLMDIYKLERVQRHFTRRLVGMSGLTYGQRLDKLGIESLELRRLKLDLVYTFKIMHCLVGVSIDIFEFSKMDNLRGHDCKLVKPSTKINCRLHSFIARVVDPWNSLPQAAISAANVLSFKCILNTINFSKHLHVLL